MWRRAGIDAAAARVRVLWSSGGVRVGTSMSTSTSTSTQRSMRLSTSTSMPSSMASSRVSSTSMSKRMSTSASSSSTASSMASTSTSTSSCTASTLRSSMSRSTPMASTLLNFTPSSTPSSTPSTRALATSTTRTSATAMSLSRKGGMPTASSGWSTVSNSAIRSSSTPSTHDVEDHAELLPGRRHGIGLVPATSTAASARTAARTAAARTPGSSFARYSSTTATAGLGTLASNWSLGRHHHFVSVPQTPTFEPEGGVRPLWRQCTFYSSAVAAAPLEAAARPSARESIIEAAEAAAFARGFGQLFFWYGPASFNHAYRDKRYEFLYNTAVVQPLRCRGVPAAFTWRLAPDLVQLADERSEDGTRPLHEYLTSFTKAQLVSISRSNRMYAHVVTSKHDFIAALCGHIDAAVRSGRVCYGIDQWNQYVVRADLHHGRRYRLVTLLPYHYAVSHAGAWGYFRYFTKDEIRAIVARNGWTTRTNSRSVYADILWEFVTLVFDHAPEVAKPPSA